MLRTSEGYVVTDYLILQLFFLLLIVGASTEAAANGNLSTSSGSISPSISSPSTFPDGLNSLPQSGGDSVQMANPGEPMHLTPTHPGSASPTAPTSGLDQVHMMQQQQQQQQQQSVMTSQHLDIAEPLSLIVNQCSDTSIPCQPDTSPIPSPPTMSSVTDQYKVTPVSQHFKQEVM